MKIRGNVFLLDRANVDTDQIIPAKYLTGISKKGLGKHLFEGVPDFNREDDWFKKSTILVAGENFGCGSSREHAVWSLQDHGFQAVIATSFARIFRQNAVNCGLVLIELPQMTIGQILGKGFSKAEIDLEKGTIKFSVPGLDSMDAEFNLSSVDKALITAGGLIGFVAKRY